MAKHVCCKEKKLELAGAPFSVNENKKFFLAITNGLIALSDIYYLSLVYLHYILFKIIRMIFITFANIFIVLGLS